MPYDYRNPPPGVFDDEWMEIFMAGQKIGYAHNIFRREGDQIFSQQNEVFRMGRLGSVLEMSGEIQGVETLDGSARTFNSTMQMASQPTVVQGSGDGKIFDITTQTNNFKQQKQVTFPENTFLPWGAERLSRMKGLAPGTTYDYLSYDPSQDAFQPLPTKITIGTKEKIKVHGVEVEATRVVTHLGTAGGGAGGIDTIAWVDDENRAIRATVPMGGLTMNMDIATKEQALGDYAAKDIFSGSLIPLNHTIPANAASVTFLLRRDDGQALPAPPESLSEHSEVLPDGSVRMTLTRPGAEAAALSTPLKDLTPYLERNSFLDTSDPLLRRLAAQGGGPPEPNPLVVARLLRTFVANYINQKDLSVGFATASEAAQSREGDCTEHAVLLAALGRIRNLPARVVSGLVYLPSYEGQSNILGFHMWTQFYFNGQWVTFDSALTDGNQPYWRLGLVATDLNEVSLSDFTMQLMSWMSGLKITVGDVTTVAPTASH